MLLTVSLMFIVLNYPGKAERQQSVDGIIEYVMKTYHVPPFPDPPPLSPISLSNGK